MIIHYKKVKNLQSMNQIILNKLHKVSFKLQKIFAKKNLIDTTVIQG